MQNQGLPNVNMMVVAGWQQAALTGRQGVPPSSQLKLDPASEDGGKFGLL